MGEPKVRATLHGKHHDYEVKEQEHTIAANDYYVKRDDDKCSGRFDSLADAVDWAKDQARKS